MSTCKRKYGPGVFPVPSSFFTPLLILFWRKIGNHMGFQLSLFFSKDSRLRYHSAFVQLHLPNHNNLLWTSSKAGAPQFTRVAILHRQPHYFVTPRYFEHFNFHCLLCRPGSQRRRLLIQATTSTLAVLSLYPISASAGSCRRVQELPVYSHVY